VPGEKGTEMGDPRAQSEAVSAGPQMAGGGVGGGSVPPKIINILKNKMNCFV